MYRIKSCFLYNNYIVCSFLSHYQHFSFHFAFASFFFSFFLIYLFHSFQSLLWPFPICLLISLSFSLSSFRLFLLFLILSPIPPCLSLFLRLLFSPRLLPLHHCNTGRAVAVDSPGVAVCGGVLPRHHRLRQPHSQDACL